MKVHTGKKFCMEFIKDQCQAHSQYTLKTYQKVKLLYVKSLLGILIYFQKFLRLTRGQITHFGASAILRVTKRDQISLVMLQESPIQRLGCIGALSAAVANTTTIWSTYKESRGSNISIFKTIYFNTNCILSYIKLKPTKE